MHNPVRLRGILRSSPPILNEIPVNISHDWRGLTSYWQRPRREYLHLKLGRLRRNSLQPACYLRSLLRHHPHFTMRSGWHCYEPRTFDLRPTATSSCLLFRINPERNAKHHHAKSEPQRLALLCISSRCCAPLRGCKAMNHWIVDYYIPPYVAWRGKNFAGCLMSNLLASAVNGCSKNLSTQPRSKKHQSKVCS